jgi:hypothetical protein
MDREAENNKRIKFLVSLDDGEYEEIMAYNELSDLIERQHTQEPSGELEVFTLKGVTDHQGPLRKSDPRYKGSSYNVLMTWEDGSKTWEPVSLVMKDDTVTLAAYTKAHNLLDMPSWKSLKDVANNTMMHKRMLNQSNKLRSSQRAIKYTFSVKIPQHRFATVPIWIDTAHFTISSLVDKTIVCIGILSLLGDAVTRR